MLMVRGNDKSAVLEISLLDVLSVISKGSVYHWKVLWLMAFGKSESQNILELENRINNSTHGFSLNWIELNAFARQFSQIIEIVVIGDRDPKNLIRYKKDVDMISNCEFVFELVDSSYWELHSSDNHFNEQVILFFDGVSIHETKNKV